MEILVHRNSCTICIIQLEALEHILNVIGFVDEGSLSEFLDLKSEEELDLPHHAHI
jgi:hypothetical protein